MQSQDGGAVSESAGLMSKGIPHRATPSNYDGSGRRAVRNDMAREGGGAARLGVTACSGEFIRTLLEVSGECE